MQDPAPIERNDRRCGICGAALPGCTCSPEGLHHNRGQDSGRRPDVDPPEQELEEALASLALSPTGIPAESLWYQAGLARERRRANRWRMAAAVALLAAGAAVYWRPKPVTVAVDRVVVVREQANQPAPPPGPTVVPAGGPEAQSPQNQFASASYLRLRDRVLEDGLKSLPPTAAGQGDAAAAMRAWPVPDGAGAIESSPIPKHTFIQGG
jgi:hypothetical protein